MLASIFIDPRVRILLNKEQRGIALKHLSRVRRRLNIPINVTEIISSGSCATSELAKIVRNKNEALQNTYAIPEEQYFSLISSAPSTENFGLSTMENWSYIIKTNPDIFAIISAVNTAASTQVSVERAFSRLAYILSSRLCKFSDNSLDDTLVTGLNKSILSSVLEEISFNE